MTKVKLLLVALFIFNSFGFDMFAQGDLLITPNRVIFEGKKQKEELNLINAGKETTTFSASFVQRRMNEDGSFESIEVPDPDQPFADPYLRIYPRQVTLNPGEGQVILLQFKRKPDMKDGEYRSHLYFRSEKNYTPLGTKNKDTLKTLSVQLTPIFGISIPIIIRSGNVNASSSLSNLKIENDKEPTLKFVLNRTGNISVYGDIKVDFIPSKGKSHQIGVVKGVSVYTNINKRYMSLKLDSTVNDLKNGMLRLRYTSRDDSKKQEVFAEAELKL